MTSIYIITMQNNQLIVCMGACIQNIFSGWCVAIQSCYSSAVYNYYRTFPTVFEVMLVDFLSCKAWHIGKQARRSFCSLLISNTEARSNNYPPRHKLLVIL